MNANEEYREPEEIEEEGDAEAAGPPPPPPMGILDEVSERLGAAPWWVISATVHACLLLLMTLIVIMPPKRPDTLEPFCIPIVPPRKLEPPMASKEYNPFNNSTEVPEDVPIEFVPEVDLDIEESDHDETADNDERRKAKFNERDSLSKVMSETVGVVDFLGVGVGGFGGHGFRTGRLEGGLKNLKKRRYGAPKSIHVNAALEWLARHQEPAGNWDAAKYGGQKTGVGVTGLALMAFLGDGHCELTRTKYTGNVRRATKWLISQQAADGCIGRGYARGLGYHHAIAGLALAEASAMNRGRIARVNAAAQKAVDYSVEKHQTEYSGWRYSAKQKPDTSVTGWFVMQLKSAKVAGMKVDGRAFQGAVTYLDTVTGQGDYPGRVSYMPGRSATQTMTAVGVLSRQFMGWKADEPVVRGGIQFVMQDVPRWRDNSDVNFYYWYYGTLAVFQDSCARDRQVSAEWKRWNEAMKKALTEHQCKGGDDDGSWDPVGTWCSAGGRVYSTALGALCLEVYWRYNFAGTYTN